MKKKVLTAVVREPKIIIKIINQSQLNELSKLHATMGFWLKRKLCVFFASHTFLAVLLNHESLYILVFFQAERVIYYSASFY